MKTETVSRTVYVALDGRKFNDKSECVDYEAAINRASKFKILKAKLDAIECIENSYAPFGYSYIDDERYEYRWYRPKNQEEVDALNSFFNINIECNGSDDKVIGEWVGVEIDGDYDSYTGEEDVYVISSLDSSIKKLVDFYAALGYDVKIEKTIDNKGDSL